MCVCYKRLKIDLRIFNYSTNLFEHLNLKSIYYTILNHYLLRELMEMIWRDKGYLYNAYNRCLLSAYVTVESTKREKYQCVSCRKTYLHERNLVKHQRYECGEKRPFTCNLCPYSSKQKGHLKLHIFTKHSQNTNI